MAQSCSDRLLVAAIDFGTTYSGYAFQFRHEFEMDPLKITTNVSWVAGGQGLVSWKAPTTVLLDPEGNFRAFGYEAEEKYSDLAENEEHHSWYYFRRFKMLLHGKMGFERNVTIEEAMGKTMPAKTIFKFAIQYLSENLLGMIRNRGIDFSSDDIQWVLTIPAIWNEPAKQFMREAAVEGGIETNQLKLALEPEAASVYCKTVPSERLDTDGRGEMGPFKPNTKYMVLDIGGGTVDVTVHEVLPNGTLKELHKASGGAWGGTQVDKSYFNLFKQIFGEEVMNEFAKEYKVDHLDMQRDFEVKKRSIKAEDAKVNIRIAVSLKEVISDICGQNADAILRNSQYGGRITLKRDRMTLEGSVIKEMFQPSIDSIIKHVQEVRQVPKVHGLEIILMVGGFSESPLIREALTKAFPDLRVVAPDDPGLAVVKGAVLFGHIPNVISSRVSKCTVGVAAMAEFDKRYHPENKKFMTKCGTAHCRDLFSRFVKAGEDLENNQRKSREFDITDRQSRVVVEIFASSDECPRFTTDQNCSKLGQIFVNAPVGGWRKQTKLKIEMDFSGTEFSVTATDVSTQRSYEATFDFLL